MNNVELIGRLTRDPELNYNSANQMAVCKFSIAIDRMTKAGEEKKTDFPNIVVFGKQAENCNQYLSKGRLVGISGRLETNSYEMPDGSRRTSTYVVARGVEFLERARQQQEEYMPF